MQVRVYRNLHKKTYSIQAKTPKGWRVVEHRDFLFLSEAYFNVSEAGRQRVLREKRKNVHAYVEGELIENACFKIGDQIRYNPYRASTFTDEQGKQVNYSKCVYLNAGGIFKAKEIK